MKDDPGWGRDTLLTSQYSALFLANPFLEYIDLSNTGLTNNGIFHLILELSYCDPSVSPYGHKCLKQVVLGPPFEASGRAGYQEPFMKTSLSTLQELYLQSPVLELVCLIHPVPLESPMLQATRNLCRAMWAGFDENNQVSDSLYQGKPCSLLRTRCATASTMHLRIQTVLYCGCHVEVQDCAKLFAVSISVVYLHVGWGCPRDGPPTHHKGCERV